MPIFEKIKQKTFAQKFHKFQRILGEFSVKFRRAVGDLKNRGHTGKRTAECWFQNKGICIFIEIVWDNCFCLKVE